MTASYQPTVVPNKDLGIWNEPVKIVINSCLYNVTICFVIRDAKRKNMSFWPKQAMPFLAGISKALPAKTWINEYFGGFIPNP